MRTTLRASQTQHAMEKWCTGSACVAGYVETNRRDGCCNNKANCMQSRLRVKSRSRHSGQLVEEVFAEGVLGGPSKGMLGHGPSIGEIAARRRQGMNLSANLLHSTHRRLSSCVSILLPSSSLYSVALQVDFRQHSISHHGLASSAEHEAALGHELCSCHHSFTTRHLFL
jgi:hypothetical protein